MAVVLWTLGCRGLQLPVIQGHVAVVLWTLVSVWAQRRNERMGPDENAGENAGEDPYDIIHIPFFTIRPHTRIYIYIYIANLLITW